MATQVSQPEHSEAFAVTSEILCCAQDDYLLPMKQLPCFLLLLLFCLGCGHRIQPNKYQGKPLHYWESQAESENPDNRRAAAKALGEIGPNGVPTLLILSRDRDTRVRTSASLALLGMGKNALPRLIESLRGPDPKLRSAAVKAIQSLGPDAKEAIPALKEALQDSNPNIRRASATALMLLGEKKSRNQKILSTSPVR